MYNFISFRLQPGRLTHAPIPSMNPQEMIQKLQQAFMNGNPLPAPNPALGSSMHPWMNPAMMAQAAQATAAAAITMNSPIVNPSLVNTMANQQPSLTNSPRTPLTPSASSKSFP